MSEARMIRESEIREWLDQIPAMGFDPTDAVEYVRELLAENARLARQGEVLAMEFVRTHSREDVQNWENRYQYGDRSDYAIRMHNVFDALAGEGGMV